MIIQGSNNPLTIEFSEDVSALPELVVTVWSDLPKYHGTALKTWTKSMITDVSDTRLEIAKSVGADVCVNTMNKDFGEAMIECFGPDKADVIYDCAGNDITMNQAIQNARKGSVIILVAVFAKMANVDLAKLNDSELDLNTSMMYRHEDYVDALRFVSEGKIQLKPLQTAHFAFKDYLAAYQYIDANRETTMKVLIDVDPVDD